MQYYGIGPWHYREVLKNQKPTLLQIQNRDKIKYEEIINFGYKLYIIKDLKGKFNEKFVVDEFNKFINYLDLE